MVGSLLVAAWWELGYSSALMVGAGVLLRRRAASRDSSERGESIIAGDVRTRKEPPIVREIWLQEPEKGGVITL